MTEHHEDPVADIAWMRRLAEEGAQAPMQGAPILMAAGLTFGAGSLAFWAELNGMFEVPGITGVSWLAATVAFLAILIFNLTGSRRRTGVMTAAVPQAKTSVMSPLATASRSSSTEIRRSSTL